MAIDCSASSLMTLFLFSQGKISHDDHSRLRKINKVLQKAIDDGVPDDAAPSAQAAAKEPASPEQAARVQGFLQGAVERVFSNSQTSDFEPEWKSAPFDGDITSQREIWRMVRAFICRMASRISHTLNHPWCGEQCRSFYRILA